MAWEERSGRSYYYQKKWSNGTCKSEYVGAGAYASLIAQASEVISQEQHLKRLQAQQERAKLERLERKIERICQAIEQIVHAVLVATGHHQHRGQWRKKMPTKEESKAIDRLRAGKGSAADEDIFKAMLKEAPGIVKAIDIVPQTIRQTIDKMAGPDQSAVIAWKEKTKQLKSEMGYEEGSLIEQLVIEQIVLCRLRLYWVEYLLSVEVDKVSAGTVEHWEKRVSANQRRYLRAIETLARVRKLASRTPEILQINTLALHAQVQVAQQQVNRAN